MSQNPRYSVDRFRIQSLLCFWLLVSAQALAGPYDEAITAYDQGKFDTAFVLWLPLAEQGHAAAQFNLGVLFEKGLGVAQNYSEAARWYLKAAEQGDTEAQYNVGALYEKGSGLSRDLDKARRWYGMVIANHRTDRTSLEIKGRARQRLAYLAPVTDEVIAFEGGRFVLRRSQEGTCVIALQGSVTRDATWKFDDVVNKSAAIGCSKTSLMLESPGGSLDAGIRLGREVRMRGLQTIARYECASACSIIFLGGVDRVLMGSRARVGFHRSASTRGTDRWCDESLASYGVSAMRKYLSFAIPANDSKVFEVIMRTSCDSIQWISGQRALELGIATKLELENIDIFGPKAENVDRSTNTYLNGEKYVGEFKDGKRNGQGTLTYSNGEKYIGEFKDGYFSGQGTFTYPDLRKFVGEFKDGVPNGQGIEFRADGSVVQSGIWENGVFRGQ